MFRVDKVIAEIKWCSFLPHSVDIDRCCCTRYGHFRVNSQIDKHVKDVDIEMVIQKHGSTTQ